MKRQGAKQSLIEGVWLAACLIGLCVWPNDGYAQGLGALVGQKAPAFSIPGIWDEPYSSETFKGHILVMQFGSSW
jgi:hypothetical protein